MNVSGDRQTFIDQIKQDIFENRDTVDGLCEEIVKISSKILNGSNVKKEDREKLIDDLNVCFKLSKLKSIQVINNDEILKSVINVITSTFSQTHDFSAMLAESLIPSEVNLMQIEKNQIKANVDSINARNENGDTPLCLLFKNNAVDKWEAAKRLVEAGADVNLNVRYNNTICPIFFMILDDAVKEKDNQIKALDLIQFCISNNKMDISICKGPHLDSPLCRVYECPLLFQMLLENKPELIKIRDAFGFTPLHRLNAILLNPKSENKLAAQECKKRLIELQTLNKSVESSKENQNRSVFTYPSKESLGQKPPLKPVRPLLKLPMQTANNYYVARRPNILKEVEKETLPASNKIENKTIAKKRQNINKNQQYINDQFLKYLKVVSEKEKSPRDFSVIANQDIKGEWETSGQCNGYTFLEQYYSATGRSRVFMNAMRTFSKWSGDSKDLESDHLLTESQKKIYSNLGEMMEKWLNDIIWFQGVIQKKMLNMEMGQLNKLEQYKVVAEDGVEINYEMNYKRSNYTIAELEKEIDSLSSKTGLIINIYIENYPVGHVVSARVLPGGKFQFTDPNAPLEFRAFDSSKELALFLFRFFYNKTLDKPWNDKMDMGLQCFNIISPAH